MSNVGDALSTGSTDGTGITDSTLSDASLGDQMMGGDGSFGTGDASAFGAGSGPSEFSQASDLATALSPGGAGGSSIGAQAASMTPPATAAATGGDPTGAASGTQSNTTPGSSPTDQNQQQQGGGGGQKTQDPNYAPPQAVSQLKALLKQLNSGKPAGPTGPTPTGGQAAPFALPTLAAGQTGAQSPRMSLPQLAAGQTGPQSTGSFYGTSVQPQTTGVNDIAGSAPAAASIPPGAASQPTAAAAADGTPAVDAQGNPVTAAGTRADQTPLPPSRPGDQTADAGQAARDITVNARKTMEMPGKPPQPDLPTVVPPGSAAHPLPTHKGGPAPAPAQGPASSQIMRDISGVSTGSPTALADLAQAARILLPLAGMFMGGGRGRRGGFRGGRFTHGFGGGGFGHLHGGQHPAARGAWPYHHPQMGWHFHGRPPGPGWRPLHPNDAQSIVGGGMGGDQSQQQGQPGQQDPNAPDPNKPPAERDGGAGGQPDDDFVKSGFSSNPFIDALVTQESGGRGGIVSKTDKDSQGRTLAQGGNPNEISQGYFQIQNHPGGTWQTYGRQAGIDLNKYPTPRSAPLAVQWQVASRIPIGQWGDDTKAILRQKFGNFDPKMPFGQVAARFNRAGGSLAQKPSNIEPAWAAASPKPTLPLTSQPMVAGQ